MSLSQASVADRRGTRRLRRRGLGYASALAAGALWGTTGPLSTALYAEGAALTGIGFWRIAVAVACLGAVGLLRPGLLRIDRRGLLIVGLGGGALVALFEVAYQFAIAGTGVAAAAALLYTAPVMVAFLARALLKESLSALRVLLAVGVMIGAGLTVSGGSGVSDLFATRAAGLVAGVFGGLLAAVAYAGTTLVARFAVPRYGSLRVLFVELAGGTAILALVLPLTGHAPSPPATVGGWTYVALLAGGAVLGANFLFFAALRRIEAAPTAVAATIEPVVGAVLALVLFEQGLTVLGWVGLSLVVISVAAGYLQEGRAGSPDAGLRREPRYGPLGEAR